ncbi:MAG: LysM peptidoglycan-binding domain-containing protein, partial [Lachnospiraceae bacterium]|nr:LysM peptidoglycan-binding domain-containing protein [Lachnospiraceae bacterium]
IYVEDYVVSFLKQLNKIAADKDMSVALYGGIKKEGAINYIFVYGAGKVDFLQKEVRHLSQAQLQEMEKLRIKYFQDSELVGYKILNGEMIEGMHVYEQGICRYIAGYAQFYEKNDNMLAYMLDFRGGEAQPEVVNREKYETVRKRQEERRIRSEEAGKAAPSDTKKTAASDGISDSERRELKAVWSKGRQTNQKSLRRMKSAVAAAFVLLCIAGIAMTGTEDMDGIKTKAKSLIGEITEQKLPDSVPASGNVQQNADSTGSTLVAEDKLAEAVLKENEAEQNAEAETEADVSEASYEASAETPTETSYGNISETENADNEETVTSETEASSGEVYYTIKKGDTLLDISLSNYGSVSKINEICSLNQIENPDDIKVGQKILLP